MTPEPGSAGTTTAMSEVERRIVSVLFADLVGFTPLSERLDAEDVATIQDAYFALVRETVGRYGGQLEKFIGDAAMAVFGVPRARDDDAERAVRAGLALVAAVEQLGARLGLEQGTLRLRVGINTGEVVHAVDGPDAGRVTGDTVNTAARLQAATAAGTVLVGEETALAVAEAIDIEAVPPLELKGKSAAVRAFVATAVRPQRSRELAMGSLRAPTIGREREVERLVGRIAAIARAREPITERWLVVAPPGVGKTRLVEEVVRWAELEQPAPVVRRIRLRPETSAPYAPLTPLAVAVLADAGLEPAAPAVAPLAELLAAGGIEPLRARIVARELLDLAGVSGLEEDRAGRPDRDQRFGAWLEALDVLGDRPELWVVEDLHWAAPDLVAFLERATATASPRGGRLILATARPSFLESAPAWAGEPEHGAPSERTAGGVIELATLDPTDAAGLVRALVGVALPEALVEAIAARSDGNCLFIEELLRTWVGTGALVEVGPDEGRWRLAVPAEQIPLPATVQAIYAAQLDDLPAGARQAARRGAVAGRRFPVRALETLGVGEPAQAVEELRRRALVAGPLPDRVSGDTFAYRHALLRDAGYASLARAERADLHVRLARWLEAAAGAEVDEVAASVGVHLAAGLASAPGLGAEVVPGVTRAALAAEAAGWLERAGDAAVADGAIATAAASYRRAAGLTDGEAPADDARRLTKLGRALAPTGGVEEAEEAFARAIDSARRARDAGDRAWRERFAEAVEALAALLFERIRFVEAWRLGEDALAEMGDGDDVA
ncbi:MAG TPA: adenylate/guanylate cyclase domain-containing protein, partial [Candidatus Limnocylindrales bacterium]|nr:adenylate/guanylate cyclase domain-containing protein [Candidatus Limnocylindrales bacterium]